MKRRTIPEIGMTAYGQEHLRREGFVAMPLETSTQQDPQRGLPHTHDFFQITLLKGPGWLMHDFRETNFASTTLFFLSPGQVHTASQKSGTGATVVSFTREFLEAHTPGFLTNLPFFYATSTSPWLTLPSAEATIAEGIFREIQEEFDHAKSGAADMLRALLHVLFVHATRWYVHAHPEAKASRGSHLTKEFHLLVERHFRNWLELEPYARTLGVTVNHLNDVVREKTGQAAGEHIRLRRLLDAKRLLLHSDLSISEIGYQLGFRDPSYFSRFFRRYEEVTPVNFKAEIREKYHS